LTIHDLTIQRSTIQQFNVKDLFDIVPEDADLLVINKPAGLACHPTKSDGHSSLVCRVRAYLGPDVTPRLVNRLDRETSGVVLVVKTPEAARELGRVFESRSVAKEYLALVHGHVAGERGLIDARLGKDERKCCGDQGLRAS
jgi:23S rRNA pseudouridine1911/1915/1917 synthase